MSPPRPARRVRGAGMAVLASLALCLHTGCVRLPRENPAFPASNSDIRAHGERMVREPVGVDRPVIVLGGWRSPPMMINRMAGRIARLTGAPREQVVPVSYFWTVDIEPLSERVVKLVESRWPSEDPGRTVEVDVVALSMGGLVARRAASECEPDSGKRLRIGALYTIATPHRGARIADLIRPDPASRQMRRGSAMLARLDAALETCDYELVAYATLNDMIVGATRASPPGHDPVWTPGRLLGSHLLVSRDERILTDISARLRGEPPLGRASPPPSN